MERLEPEVPAPRPGSDESDQLVEALAVAGEDGALIFFRRFFRQGDTLERDESGSIRSLFTVVQLVGDQMDIGNHPGCEVVIDWDPAVARAHAQLKKAGVDWYVDTLDEVNGTIVNGERVDRLEEHFLGDGDQLRLGDTVMVFRQPGLQAADPPEKMVGFEEPPSLSEAQKRILVELVRPMVGPGSGPTPAANSVIARSLHLELDTVKGHLRRLYDLFGLEDLPAGAKREALAAKVIELGVVTRRDLD